jgi:hypothetical protein
VDCHQASGKLAGLALILNRIGDKESVAARTQLSRRKCVPRHSPRYAEIGAQRTKPGASAQKGTRRLDNEDASRHRSVSGRVATRPGYKLPQRMISYDGRGRNATPPNASCKNKKKCSALGPVLSTLFHVKKCQINADLKPYPLPCAKRGTFRNISTTDSAPKCRFVSPSSIQSIEKSCACADKTVRTRKLITGFASELLRERKL